MKVAMEAQGEKKDQWNCCESSHGSARGNKRINGIVGKVDMEVQRGDKRINGIVEKVAMEVQGEIKGSMELLGKLPCKCKGR